jgi:cytochrome b561
MQNLKTSGEKYGILRRFNHWVVGLMFIALLVVGVYMSNFAQAPLKWDLYSMHKSFGVIIMLFIAARIIWLLFDNKIDNKSLTKFERIASASTHGILYLLMIIMPVSGMLMSMAKGYSVKVFDWFTLPMLVEKNETIATAASITHEFGGYVAIAMVLFHIVAALYHHFVKKDNVLRRMV